jgi:hypothetical protein
VGIFYEGPYAEQVGYQHEGYAARRLPDGSLTSSWTAETRVFTAYVAACDCGWEGTAEFPPTDEGRDAAERAWDAEHLQPLIAEAKRSWWPDWLRRVGGRAETIADHMAAGRHALAMEVCVRLAEDVAAGRRIVEQLAERDGGACRD